MGCRLSSRTWAYVEHGPWTNTGGALDCLGRGYGGCGYIYICQAPPDPKLEPNNADEGRGSAPPLLLLVFDDIVTGYRFTVIKGGGATSESCLAQSLSCCSVARLLALCNSKNEGAGYLDIEEVQPF